MSFVQVARLSSRSLCIAQQCWVGLGLCSNRIFRDLWDLWQLHVFIIEYLVKIHIYTPLRSFCACLFLVAPCLHTSDSHLVDHRLIDLHSPKLLSSESDHPAIRNESVTGRFRSDILEKLSKASDSNSDVFSRWPQEGWCNSNFMSQKLIFVLPTLMWVCSSFSLFTYIQRSLGPQKVLLRRKSPPQTGFQLPTYLSVFPPSEVRRNLDQYKVSSRAIFIPSHSQTLQKSALHKEYSTKGEESEDCPGPGARIREDQSGKMSPGEGGSGGSGLIQDAYWWRRCEVPESGGRRRDCYMCVTFSDQVLIKAYSLDSLDADTSIEAPPSILPQSRYCDIAGLKWLIHF